MLSLLTYIYATTNNDTVVYQFDIRMQYRPPLSVINISIIKQTIHQYLKKTYLH